jgi:hypothetical protein
MPCRRSWCRTGSRARSRLAHEPLAVAVFTMSNSAVLFVPAARWCARVLSLWSRPSPWRGGRSADRRTYVVVAFARRDGSARVRRGAPHDAGRSPLGAPPWRFLAGGRASISGIASGSVQRAPRSQVIMPGGRCPGPPEPAVTSRGRRTPLPAPPFRTVSGRRPSMSEDANPYTINPLRSQYLNSNRSRSGRRRCGRCGPKDVFLCQFLTTSTEHLA